MNEDHAEQWWPAELNLATPAFKSTATTTQPRCPQNMFYDQFSRIRGWSIYKRTFALERLPSPRTKTGFHHSPLHPRSSPWRNHVFSALCWGNQTPDVWQSDHLRSCWHERLVNGWFPAGIRPGYAKKAQKCNIYRFDGSARCNGYPSAPGSNPSSSANKRHSAFHPSAYEC